ncbi:MAG TPA: hypothetical protein VET66_03635 [Steroidobacteraceae bacterium]|nr:hypothetical protein [Steroidobacteraceae bacterium]
MIFAREVLGQELVLIGTIALALGVIYGYLRWRGQLDALRRLWPPSLLWVICGTLDALITMVGTANDPTREANSILRGWLVRDGWVGQLIYTFPYILIWAGVVIGLEELRRRVRGAWAFLLGALQLTILYSLALGHLYGFLSWTPSAEAFAPLFAFVQAHAPWLLSDSLIGYFIDVQLVIGLGCVALQLAITALLRWVGARSAAPSSRRDGSAGGKPAT